MSVMQRALRLETSYSSLPRQARPRCRRGEGHELKREVVAGQERTVWNPALAPPSRLRAARSTHGRKRSSVHSAGVSELSL